MRWPLVLILFALALVACGPAPTPMPAEAPTPSPIASPLAAATATRAAVAEEGAGAMPALQLRYRREGRFPDSPQQWTLHTTGLIEGAEGKRVELAPEVVAPLFSLVLSKPFASLDEQYGPVGACRDCLTHTLTLEGDSLQQQVTVVEGAAEIPPLLQEALDALDVLVSQQR